MSESGKVIVTKSKLDGLANAINNKAQSPGPKTIAQLTQTVNDMKTGGSSVFLVTLTTPTDIPGYTDQVTSDKKFTEILAAYRNGDIVRATWHDWVLDLVQINSMAATFAVLSHSDVNVNESPLECIIATCSLIDVDRDEWDLKYDRRLIPLAATVTPKAPGTATPGTSAQYARQDHVHPKELPTVTATDNGKFLRVVSGAWAAVEIANANGGSF